MRALTGAAVGMHLDKIERAMSLVPVNAGAAAGSAWGPHRAAGGRTTLTREGPAYLRLAGSLAAGHDGGWAGQGSPSLPPEQEDEAPRSA